MVAANVPLGTGEYVAILKGKASELGAAESCLLETVVPLFEVSTLAAAADGLIRSWPAASGVVWVHCLNLSGQDEDTFAAGAGNLFARLHPEAQAVPVVTTSEPAAVWHAIRAVVAEQDRGLVLRLEIEQMLGSPSALTDAIEAALTACGVTPQAVDVLIDAGLLTDTPAARATVVTRALSALPYSAAWRSLVVALSAFPTTVSSVGKDTVGEFPRDDAATFDLVVAEDLPRRPSYADYALGTPSHAAPPPRSPVPNIKYTHERTWKVHRAHEQKRPSPQYRALAADVAAAPYFASARTSPGDDYIAGVASRACGPGNAMTHLRAGLSRHVHVVAHRLATLGVP